MARIILVFILGLLLPACKEEAPPPPPTASESKSAPSDDVTTLSKRQIDRKAKGGTGHKAKPVIGIEDAMKRADPLPSPSPPSPGAVATKTIQVLQDFAVVRVLYATDRDRTASTTPSPIFGARRSSISYGYCDVSIPRTHKTGSLESPSLLRFELREDPAKHVILKATAVTTKEEFFRDLRARVQGSSNNSAFMFVHGYNVTFADAARRTAQIHYDLAFSGAPVFYSWPSQGQLPAYTVDEQNIEWAQSNLKMFLDEFFMRSNARNVYLIAHSMGNRALTRAVAALLNEKPELRSRLTEVILAAPDIDADVFKRDIAPALVALGQPITLYASSNDLALAASKRVHGYPRAGDSGNERVVVSGIETVDATGTDSEFLGHSYFANNRSVLSDLYDLIKSGRRANHRSALVGVDAAEGRYWAFKRAASGGLP